MTLKSFTLGYITNSELYQAFTNKVKLNLNDEESFAMQNYFRSLNNKISIKDFSKNFVNQIKL